MIIDHLEYLLRRHDCVTVPGIGAFMARYKSAAFDASDNTLLLPPTRQLVFNGLLVESDGILENSVARCNGVSFEVASRMVAEEAASLLHQLKCYGSLMLGPLGELTYTEYSTIVFAPGDTSRWDFRFYGLRPLSLREISMAQPADERVVNDVAQVKHTSVINVTPWPADDEPVPDSRAGRFTRSIVGIAASLAVIVSLALFFINPIKVANEPLQASLAPQVSTESVVSVEPMDVEVDEDNIESPDEMSVMESVAESRKEPEATAPSVISKPEAKPVLNFNPSDPYCVIVASFPAEDQAERYISENSGKQLGVLQQDGKYRVYAATGRTYEEAAAQKGVAGTQGAWICRR